MGWGKEDIKNLKTNNKIIGFNPVIAIFILNVNGLNTPIKMQRLSDGIKKQGPTILLTKI